MAKATGIPIIPPFPPIAITLNRFLGSTTADWQTGESLITVIGGIAVFNFVHSLLLNIGALAGNVTIRLYTDIDIPQIQSYSETFSVALDGPGLWIINGILAIDGIVVVTAQSDAVADNGQPIGWKYILGGT